MTHQHQAERMMGLKSQTRKFLANNSVKMETNGDTYMGLLSIPYYLNQYRLIDGRVLHEQVQAECGEENERAIFVALRDENNAWIPESLWNSEERWLAML